MALALASATLGYALYSWGIPYLSSIDSDSIPETARIQSSGAGILGTERAAFSLPDLEGKTHSIDDWKGKVVLINFWATWCPPCRKEIPEFDALRQRYVKEGFEIVGLAFDEQEQVKQFVQDMGLHYPQLIANLSDSELMRLYGNQHGALPYSVLIDREGVIRFVHSGALGGDQLERELLKLI